MSLPLPDLQVVRESLPAKVRLAIYVAFALLTVGASAVTVAFAAAGIRPPVELVVATAVLLFLQGPVNTISALNVSKPIQVASVSPAVLTTGSSSPASDEYSGPYARSSVPPEEVDERQ